MLRIPFAIKTVPLVTELGFAVPARRPFLTAQFAGPLRQRIPYPAFLDTGSAYSVIPDRLARQIHWRDLGMNLISGGKVHSVEWYGIACRIGELELELVDSGSQMRSRVLLVVAKIATRAAAPHLEQAVLLGMNFLTDNRLRQELDATGLHLDGFVEIA